VRIACVTHAYPRWDGDVPGAFVERLVLALARRGHTVAVVAPADGGRGGREVRHGVTVERVRYAPARFETLAYSGTMLGAVRSPWGLTAFASLVLQLGRAAQRVAAAMDADLIHAHWWVPAGLAVGLAGRRRGGARRPYVVTLHGTDVALLDWFRPARWLAAWVLRQAAAVTAVSSYLADNVSRLAGIDRSRITVAPMPIDSARFTRLSGGGGGIVTVGRVTRQKRLALLVDAVSRLAAEGLPIALTITGDGPERPELERLVRGRGATDLIRFTGAVEPDRIPEILGDADVFGFPAVSEGLGLAAVEALMLGIPVVAARDGGGVTDVVPERGAGRLVGPDAAAFAAAIRDVLADPSARAAAADAGAALKRRFDPDAVARTFEAVYQRALGHVA
jgi:glycosyltransferase involved in cell wall biosynthesis